jgi:hypothetical protein
MSTLTMTIPAKVQTSKNGRTHMGSMSFTNSEIAKEPSFSICSMNLQMRLQRLDSGSQVPTLRTSLLIFFN